MKQLCVNSLFENIDRIAQYDFEQKKVFGSAYTVFYNGEVLKKCYGTRTLGTGDPVTDTTVFRLASMTKPITAVAALILAERGLLSLDDTVDRFLPAFADIQIIDALGNVTPLKKLPTIKSILTHTSGIGSNHEKQDTMTAKDKQSLDSAIAFYLKAGLDFEPDSMQKYSALGAFDVLAKIVEVISKTDFLTFLKKEIFEPCGMCDTTFLPGEEQWSRMAEMHNRENGKNTVFKMPDGCVFEDVPCTHFLGGAGLASTMRDYCKFAKMLLEGGKAENARILKEETVHLLRTPHYYKRPTESWGLGMRVITKETDTLLPEGVFGWSGAYGSHFWVDPTNRLFAVFMKNSKVDGGSENESAKKFEKAVYSSFLS